MNPIRFGLASLTISLVAAGCGGGDSGGGGSPSFTIELQEGGDFSISGDVALPPDTSSGHAVQLMAVVQDPSYAVIEGVGNTSGDSFGYRVAGANDGMSVRVRAAVDLNDSGSLDSGDLMGWYPGTTTAPIQTTSSASFLTITGDSLSGADFGLGAVP